MSSNRQRSPDGAEGKESVASKRRASLTVDHDSEESTATAAAAAPITTADVAPPPSQDKDEGNKPAAAAQKDQKTGANVDDDVDTDEMVDFEKMQFTFPERLLDLLESGSVESAMRWLPPRGEAFCVVPKVFYDVVLLCHFQGTKFESFTRKLNRW